MKYRSEIDGLRAVAVVPVILFHAGFELFSGGFIGVDIFFVISGYLITSIIVSEFERDKFSLLTFYERRARRILPALFFVLIACLPFAWMWLTPHDTKNFAKSLVAVSTFSYNILFWSKTGYFATAAELKPLLHTWSLAVEEQYYIFYPLFMLLTWRLGLRWVLALLSAAFVISLGLGHWGALNIPNAAFFLLPTRTWELLIGVFAAFYLRNLVDFHQRIDPRVHQGLSALGLAMIACSVFVFDKGTLIPGLPALVPTVGTALIILFATKGTWVNHLLSTKGFVGIGLISYSAYLWHQPLMVFARHRIPTEPSEWLMVLLCIATLVIAYISWRFVERPFRQKQVTSRRLVFSVGTVMAALIIVVGLAGYFANGYPSRAENALSLKIEDMIATNYGLSRTCRRGYTESHECATGKDPSLLLWGDSYAMHLAQALSASRDGNNFRQHTASACFPVEGISIYGNGKTEKTARECIEQNRKVAFWLEHSDSIKYVVLASPFSYVEFDLFLDDGSVHQYEREMILHKLEAMVHKIHRKGFRPVIVAPPPSPNFNVGQCIKRTVWFGVNPELCNFTKDKFSLKTVEVYDLLEQAQRFVPIFWLDSLICTNGTCSVMQNEIPIYRDGGHLSKLGSAYLGRKANMMKQIIELANSFDYSKTNLTGNHLNSRAD